MNANLVLPCISKVLTLSICVLVSACGGKGDSGVQQGGHQNELIGLLSVASVRDLNGETGALGGHLTFRLEPERAQNVAGDVRLNMYWASEGERIGEPWFQSAPINVLSADAQQVVLPATTAIHPDANALIVYLVDEHGESETGKLVRFHDFTGNAMLSGPGGNELTAWYYGVERPRVPIHKTPLTRTSAASSVAFTVTNAESDGMSLCVLDNGLVSVVDMQNTREETLHDGVDSGMANQADDLTFAPFSFECGIDPVNYAREVSDESGVWTYSTLNDTMYYGTVVYDALLKLLGEPPLQEKIRLRIHYGSVFSQYAFWDGAYANFGDAFPLYYSMASIDAIAHEVAHGVLNRSPNMDFFSQPFSADARTAHEAFSDITALMVKREFYGELRNWIHDEGIYGYSRHLDKIVTEPGAIESYLDYDKAGENYYLRIGMLSYPFFLLSQAWGIEQAYQVLLGAAQQCWFASMNLPEAAQCIRRQAEFSGLDESEVVAAFQEVKIQLTDKGFF